MTESARELGQGTCCLCLSEDESTFNITSIVKSLPLHEMVNFCIGIQINPTNEQVQAFSTSICNECVFTINNFYSFKKKVLEARQLIASLSVKEQVNNEHPAEYVDDAYQMQVIDITEDIPLLGETNHENLVENAEKIVEPNEQKPIKSNKMQVTSIVKLGNSSVYVKKRPNEPTNAKVPNKRPKVEPVMPTEKITIQMNECLICPAILADILQLKDHIDAHVDIKCKACGRQFARYSNLKRHFNSTHSKPKPFQCDLCGLGFNFSVNLQSHAALHYTGKIRKE